MAETTLTVKQIRDLGLWEKVCEYKQWNPWVISEGLIDYDDEVTFDSEFKIDESVGEDKLDKVLTTINNSLINIRESQKNQATKDDFIDFKNSILAALNSLPAEQDFKDALNER